MPSISEAERFDFAFDRRLQRPLSLMGVRPSTAYALITASRLVVRFGPWTIRTPLENITGAEVTGPYATWKVAGVRVSWADRGLTLGTSAEQGVCIRFHRPIRGVDPTGLLRHPGLTLTLADSPAAARRLEEIASALHRAENTGGRTAGRGRSRTGRAHASR
ncbi:hypothetical protein FHX41_1626 [Actinomadura hallensis]|uniref:PH (Pleckstrin Homology) domain-containing protein n=1 Tax=Actinomadura hallensis TaxID=337895 RepID=A0A543IBS1_9ACTN|nr:hypothetical protein [Actinomadura hallensis]TQM68001.1 hypothetical protein FHX41_1626 [Actinomadura hallensis]HLV73670.1 hypothetical protein [Vulgatibacteraceae bacterium]